MNLIEAKKILLAADLDPLVREAVNTLSPDLDFQDLPGEEWRDVAGEVIEFKDGYQVSTRGRVRSFYNGKVRLLKPRADINGYLFIELNKNGKIKQIKVHRLVAGAFIPNPEGKPFVNHISGDKADNRIENIEWVTASENARHAYDIGLRKSGCAHQNAKLNKEQVREIRLNCIPGDKNLGFKAFAEKFNMDNTAIRRIYYRVTYKNVE